MRACNRACSPGTAVMPATPQRADRGRACGLIIFSARRPRPKRLPKGRTLPPQGQLSLQVGAYRDGAAAAGVASRLKSKGVDARVERANEPGQDALHRVRLGRFGSEEEAARFGRKLVGTRATKDFTVVR